MSFPDDLWDSFDAVSKSNTKGSAMTSKLCSFLAAFGKIQHDYAKSISKLVTDKSYAGDIAFGPVQSLFDSMKSGIDAHSQAHLDLGNAVLGLTTVSQDAYKDRKKRSKVIVAAGDKMLADLKATEAKLAKCEERFHKQKKVEVKARDEFVRARDANNVAVLAKLTKKVEKEARAAEKADQEYADAVKLAQEQQARVYASDMPRVLADLEAIERETAGSARELLLRSFEAQVAMAPQVHSAAQSVIEAASAFSPAEYIQAFCDANKTGVTERPHAVYVPFDGDIAGPPGGATMSGAAMMGGGPMMGGATMSGAGTIAPAMGRGQPPMRGGSAMRGGGRGQPMMRGGMAGAPQRAPQPTPSLGQCRALFQYDATDATEISFRGGDVMKILFKDDSGWWRCETAQGVVGLCPSNFVEEISGTAQGTEYGPPPQAAMQTYGAQTSYSTSPPTDAPDDGPPFGGIVDARPARSPVTSGAYSTQSRGPSQALNTQSRGPSQVLSTDASPEAIAEAVAQAVAGAKKVKALFAYKAADADETSLEEGEVVVVEEELEGGWLLVTNGRGRRGQAPGNYVEPVE